MSPEKRIQLGELVRLHLKLAAWCGQCGRHKLIDPAPLSRQYGSATTVSQLGRRLKCSACGNKRVEARPHYAGLGVVARHDDGAD